MTNSSSQTWDAANYASNARFVSDLGAPVLDLLAPKSGERILDIGCGDGALTQKIVAVGADVVAIDHSPSQVAAARKLGLDAHVMDATHLIYANEFDGVFTNAALHWVKPPEAVVAGVAMALKPGGRFVGEFGGYGNVSKIREASIAALNARGLDGEAANPWYFPTPEDYSALLSEHGFEVTSAVLIPRPTPLPGSMADWIKTLAQDFVAPVPQEEQDDFLQGIEADLVADLQDADGNWMADYVRLRFSADYKG
jgi:trans-aconitate methyltransferase